MPVFNRKTSIPFPDNGSDRPMSLECHPYPQALSTAILVTTSVKPVKNDFGNIDLKEFSLLFTEKSTKEQFSIKTYIYSNYYYVAICYDGQIAGNNYYESEWSTGKQYGKVVDRKKGLGLEEPNIK